MNLDFNINIGRSAAPSAPVPSEGAPQKATQAPSAPSLTITQAPTSPEDITAATIPDTALTRDDDLGLLVSSAFTLPPPPMPHFPAS